MSEREPYVLVPATPAGLHPSVVPALLTWARGVNVFAMRSELDYAMVLGAVWEDARENDEVVLVVEHDVEVAADVARGLLECAQPWCVAPYNGHEALGCAKFEPAGISPWPITMPVPWLQLDQQLYRALMDGVGVGPHVHARPRPVHHHGDDWAWALEVGRSTVAEWAEEQAAREAHQRRTGPAFYGEG